jgi:hypothetical protein
MQVYVQKSTRTTFPRRSAVVSGAELSQPGRSVEARQVTLGGQRGRPGVAERIEQAHFTPPTSRTASANSAGASWGRLCPMPPSIVRCEYLPENFIA